MSNVVAFSPTQRKPEIYKGVRLSASNSDLGAIPRLKRIVDCVDADGSLDVLISLHLGGNGEYEVAGRAVRIPDIEALAGSTAMAIVEWYGGYHRLHVYAIDGSFDFTDFNYWDQPEEPA